MELIREYRQLTGKSRYKLAHELRVSQSRLKYLEEQAKGVDLYLLVRLYEVARNELSLIDFWRLVEEEAERQEATLPRRVQPH